MPPGAPENLAVPQWRLRSPGAREGTHPMKLFARIVSDAEKKDVSSQLIGELLGAAALALFVALVCQGIAIYGAGKVRDTPREFIPFVLHLPLWSSIILSTLSFCATLAA